MDQTKKLNTQYFTRNENILQCDQQGTSLVKCSVCTNKHQRQQQMKKSHI